MNEDYHVLTDQISVLTEKIFVIYRHSCLQNLQKKSDF